MWNPFKKEQKQVIIIEDSTQVLDILKDIKHTYPKGVLEIHKEFNTAADKLLEQANKILNDAKDKDVNKLERLKALGFNNVQEVIQGNKLLEDIKKSKEISKLVNRYSVSYPNNKFITEVQVNNICEKYNLVCSDIKNFKGFVPNQNLSEIEKFKEIKTDDYESSYYVLTQITLSSYDGDWKIIADNIISKKIKFKSLDKYDIVIFMENYKKNHFPNLKTSYNRPSTAENINHYTTSNSHNLLICAPINDMNIEGKTKVGNKLFEISKTEFPDPVVLKPIKGGYLILTAWGDEASDELIVNQKFN